MILYRLTLHRPEAHLFKVELQIPSPDPRGQRLALPAWIPGSYMIRDFARHIITLEARAKGEVVPTRKLDKQRWRCAPAAGPLVVTYQVYAWDLSVRGAHFDDTHAFFNGTSLFLQVEGAEQETHRLAIERPQQEPLNGWQIATTLDPADNPCDGLPGTYQAASYSELIDHPVEIGTFLRLPFSVAGTPHEMVISGAVRVDAQRFCSDLTLVCEEQIRLFGELPPMGRYLFLLTAVGEGYGGLEHRSSCALICNRDDLPQPGMGAPKKGYRRLLGLCSHEYFHLWNVKRIRPQALIDGDLSREVHTRTLWVFEGITSYYDNLALVRSGTITRDHWLEELATDITRLVRTSGRHKQSLTDSSHDAWTRFYKQGENAANAIVSYYNKGALVALALDLQIRSKSDHRLSLDNVMRVLWQRYGTTGLGLPEEGMEQLVQEVTGLDLSPFLASALYGLDELPLEEWLGHLGVGMRLRPASGAEDRGGVIDPRSAAPPPEVRPMLGITLGKGGEARVTTVAEGSPAERAGVAAGDTLIALNGIRVESSDLQQKFAQLEVEEQATLHGFRRDELRTYRVIAAAPPAETCDLWWIPECSESTERHRNGWLGAQTPVSG